MNSLQEPVDIGAGTAGIKLKVSKSGGLSLYFEGRRFPVTLYRDKWETLIDEVDKIRAFIIEHDDELVPF